MPPSRMGKGNRLSIPSCRLISAANPNLGYQPSISAASPAALRNSHRPHHLCDREPVRKQPVQHLAHKQRIIPEESRATCRAAETSDRGSSRMGIWVDEKPSMYLVSSFSGVATICERGAAAQHGQGHGLALPRLHISQQGTHGVERMAVNSFNRIAVVQPCLLGRHSRLHLSHRDRAGRYCGEIPASLRSKLSLLALAGTSRLSSSVFPSRSTATGTHLVRA